MSYEDTPESLKNKGKSGEKPGKLKYMYILGNKHICIEHLHIEKGYGYELLGTHVFLLD